MPSSWNKENSNKKEKNKIKAGIKSHTDVDKTIETNTENSKTTIRRVHTFSGSHKKLLLNEKTIKEEEDKKYETILKKSKTLLFEKNNTIKKFKAVLETILEVSSSHVDSSGLSDCKEETKSKKNNNTNNNG